MTRMSSMECIAIIILVQVHYVPADGFFTSSFTRCNVDHRFSATFMKQEFEESWRSDAKIFNPVKGPVTVFATIGNDEKQNGTTKEQQVFPSRYKPVTFSLVVKGVANYIHLGLTFPDHEFSSHYEKVYMLKKHLEVYTATVCMDEGSPSKQAKIYYTCMGGVVNFYQNKIEWWCTHSVNTMRIAIKGGKCGGFNWGCGSKNNFFVRFLYDSVDRSISKKFYSDWLYVADGVGKNQWKCTDTPLLFDVEPKHFVLTGVQVQQGCSRDRSDTTQHGLVKIVYGPMSKSITFGGFRAENTYPFCRLDNELERDENFQGEFGVIKETKISGDKLPC